MAEHFSAEMMNRQSRRRVQLAEIKPNPFQPRKCFDEEGIRKLADSIRQFGLLSPLVLSPMDDGYALVAGERRLRALKMLGTTEAEALVVTADDKECALLSLIENIERESLNFFEEAEAYRALIQTHGFSQDALAQKIGRSQSMIANRMRLLKLSPEVQSLALNLGLTERHVRALLRIPDENMIKQAIFHAAKERLSVRQFEQFITRALPPAIKKCGKPLKSVYRDHRIFVNAVLNAVKQINEAGIPAMSRVLDCADHIEVIVTLPKIHKTA